MKKLSLTIFAIFLFMIFHSTAFAAIDNITNLSSNIPTVFFTSDNVNSVSNTGTYNISDVWASSSDCNAVTNAHYTYNKDEYFVLDGVPVLAGYVTGALANCGVGPYIEFGSILNAINYYFNYPAFINSYTDNSSHYLQEYFVPHGQTIDLATDYNVSFGANGGTPPVPVTPPSCTDGIQNQGETGVDVGGPCFYVSLNWPTDVSQVPDFAQWTVAYYGNDTSINTATMQKGVMWSDNKTLLDSCLNYPSSTATYASCFALADPVHIDFGADLYISSPTHSEFIDKIGTMNPAQTYYAKAVLYSVNDTSLNRETLLSYGSDISFTIDNTVGTAGASNLCSGIDIGCILKAVFNWAFVPTQASLTQFSNLGTFLSSKAPFGYANEIYTEMTTITYNADQTPTVIIPQVQFIDDDIFTPMRNGLEWILWFSFGFYLFKRFKDIDI
jgi:hypothetical protein